MVSLNCHRMDDRGKGCEEDEGRAQGDAGGRGAGAAQAPARLWEKRICGFRPRRAATGLGANSGAQTDGSGASGCAAARLCGMHSEKRGAAAALCRRGITQPWRHVRKRQRLPHAGVRPAGARVPLFRKRGAQPPHARLRGSHGAFGRAFVRLYGRQNSGAAFARLWTGRRVLPGRRAAFPGMRGQKKPLRGFCRMAFCKRRN